MSEPTDPIALLVFNPRQPIGDRESAALLSTMDGKLWAEAFCRATGFPDVEWALAWFCNAIMAGYDQGRAKYEAELRAQRTEGRPPENLPEPELWCTACDTHIPGAAWRGACPTCGNGTMREVPFVRCLDCQMIYGGDGWLDTSLPHDQWKLIHPDEGGILCANCITARAAKLHGVIRMVTRIEFAADVGNREQVADLQSQIETLTAERDAYKRDFDAELAGNAEMRKRLGARDNETMFAFIDRLASQLTAEGRTDSCGDAPHTKETP